MPNVIEQRMRRFLRDEEGTTLVEFALAIIIFMLILLGSLDFGRFLLHYYHAERAMHIATRIAVVRPPVCSGVPEFHTIGPVDSTLPTPRFGMLCSSQSNACFNAGTQTCQGTTTSATATEIWNIVGGAFPGNANISNLQFTYTYDQNLGFLGGPYTPQVTVELQRARFRFLTPLGRFGQLVGAPANTSLDDFADSGFNFPVMGVTMPGEDLNLGTGG